MIVSFRSKDCLYPLAALIALFIAAYAFRPLIPIDETRYMTVAWEMFVQKSYSLLTINFTPYHHKPPLLFWLINLSWEIFGVSRASALLVIFGAAMAFMMLTCKLARYLFPTETGFKIMVPWLVIGSVPFLIYGTLVMFDVLLGALVLAALLQILKLAEKPDVRRVLLAGLFVGLGVLAKGPVVGLYVFAPALLYPLWRAPQHETGYRFWYLAIIGVFVLAVIPVGLWVYTVAVQSDPDFLRWLLWKQTAGRVTGSFQAAHSRPVYFYVMLLPLMAIPWMFFPRFWRGLKAFPKAVRGGDYALRFLLCWFIPVFVAFSLISGKQEHYMVPLMPAIFLLVAMFLRDSNPKHIMRAALAMVGSVILAQGVAASTVLHRYDLQPVASFVQAHQDEDWAYVRNYEGELGFLGRLTHKMEDFPDVAHLDRWFVEHPHGYAVLRHKHPEALEEFDILLSQPYRGKYIAIVKFKGQEEAADQHDVSR